MKKLLLAILSFVYSLSFAQDNVKIEIYLLKTKVPPIKLKEWVNLGSEKHFEATEKDLNVAPYILDSEILSYDSSKSFFEFTESAVSKISALNSHTPIQFVVAVNRNPVINGYFHFRETSYYLYANFILCRLENPYPILTSLPAFSLEDERKNKILIDALAATSRLK